MNCAEWELQTDAWLAGTLNERDARAVELHAASCERCAARIEMIVPAASLPRELAPPARARQATMVAVANRRSWARRRRFFFAATGIAAAAALAIVAQPHRKSASDFPGAGRVLLAHAAARSSFAELDRAEREIAAALQDHPDDQSLVAERARVQHQRDALQSLVQQVNR